ncbi:MAG: hypothetical protein NPIRA01_31990 [Nitrospirales bacterium]|nr:MAG: hypothetical protein NPIRA01_31990 [Nitrospirales bacterium]
MYGFIGEAIFWSILPVCIAFLTWKILRDQDGNFAASVPHWTVFKNPLFCGLILMFAGFVFDWLHGLFQKELSGKEEVIRELLSALSIGFFGVLALGLLICGSISILFIADRGVSVQAGLIVGLQSIKHLYGKVFLLYLGWGLNTVILAIVIGGLGSIIAAFVFPENLFVITLQSPLELSNLAEDVSDDTGKVTLNLFI